MAHSTAAQKPGHPMPPKSPAIAAQAKRPYPLWLGGVAGTLAAALTHPLDVAKVHMQTRQTGNLFVVLAQDVRKHGVRQGAYVGLTASMMRQMTYSMVRFGVYDAVKAKLVTPAEAHSPPLWKLFASGSLAGLCGGIAGNPADIILVRMISDSAKPPADRFRYRNCFDGLWKIARQEGAQTLFRGLGPNAVRAVLMNASQLATYDIFKELIVRHSGMEDGIPLHFCSSVMSGTVATTVCQPFDVIKSRIMAGSQKASALAIIKSSLAKEGPAFAFRGFWPAWIRLGPNTVAVFLLYEQLRRLVDYTRQGRH